MSDVKTIAIDRYYSYPRPRGWFELTDVDEHRVRIINVIDDNIPWEKIEYEYNNLIENPDKYSPAWYEINSK